MSFTWPLALLALTLIPLLAAAYVWAQRRRRKYTLRYSSLSLAREAVGPGPGRRRHIPAIIYLVALTAMVLALARPHAVISVPHQTGTIILTIDISGSMQATDVSPNRMEATKQAAHDFVEKQGSGVEIGIVSFSDFGSLVQAPTRDKQLVFDAIDRLRTQRGTNMGAGLQVALTAIYEAADAAPPGATPTTVNSSTLSTPDAASIVLVSDGQSTTGPPAVDIADEAARAGIKVFTVGIGTEQGAVVNTQGRSTMTRLDETTLRAIAEITGGEYYNAQNKAELSEVYDQLARQRQFEKERTELTFAMAGAALVFSIIGGGLSLFWFNRLP